MKKFTLSAIIATVAFTAFGVGASAKAATTTVVQYSTSVLAVANSDSFLTYYQTNDHSLNITGQQTTAGPVNLYYGNKLVKTTYAPVGQYKMSYAFNGYKTFKVVTPDEVRYVYASDYTTAKPKVLLGSRTKTGYHYTLSSKRPVYINVWQNKKIIYSKLTSETKTKIFIKNARFQNDGKKMTVTARMVGYKTSQQVPLQQLAVGSGFKNGTNSTVFTIA